MDKEKKEWSFVHGMDPKSEFVHGMDPHYLQGSSAAA